MCAASHVYIGEKNYFQPDKDINLEHNKLNHYRILFYFRLSTKNTVNGVKRNKL